MMILSVTDQNKQTKETKQTEKPKHNSGRGMPGATC